MTYRFMEAEKADFPYQVHGVTAWRVHLRFL